MSQKESLLLVAVILGALVLSLFFHGSGGSRYDTREAPAVEYELPSPSAFDIAGPEEPAEQEPPDPHIP